MGVPVVSCSAIRSSWKTPDRIFTVSGSWRWVTNFDWPGAALVQIRLDVGLGQRDARRAAIHHAADRGPMAFAKGGDAKQMAESVVRHVLIPWGLFTPWMPDWKLRRPRAAAA